MLRRAGLDEQGLEESFPVSIDTRPIMAEGHNRRFLSRRSPLTTSTLDFWASHGFFGGENLHWKAGSEGRAPITVSNVEGVPAEASNLEEVLAGVSSLEGVSAEINYSRSRSRNSSGDGGSDNDSEETVQDDRLVELYSSDEFRMYEFKVRKCKRNSKHNWIACPFAHPGEKARRRDPRKAPYTGPVCPDFHKEGGCHRGDTCAHAHGVFEFWLHPSRYRTERCKDGLRCMRSVCFFAHTRAQLRSSSAVDCRYSPLFLQPPLGSYSNDLLYSLTSPASPIQDPTGSDSNAFISSLTSSSLILRPLGFNLNALLSSLAISSQIQEPLGLDSNGFHSSLASSSSIIRDPPGLDSNAFDLSHTRPNQSARSPVDLDLNAFLPSVTQSSETTAMRHFPGSSLHDYRPTSHSEEALGSYATRVESGRDIRLQMFNNVLKMNQRIQEGAVAASESENDLVKGYGEKLNDLVKEESEKLTFCCQ